MGNAAKVSLTSSEIGSLWSSYMSDKMALCILENFLNHAEDQDALQTLQTAYDFSYSHVNKISSLFREEGIPVPEAFGREDFTTKGQKLYTDTFYLFFIMNVSKTGLSNYSLALTHSSRQDIRSFYTDCITEATLLFNMLADIKLNKGILIRAPIIEVNKETSFVEDKSFLEGLFKDEPRPLLSLEINSIFANMLTNVIGLPLITGFSQVAQSAEVRQYMIRGMEIASKHIKVFRSILEAEDIPVPSTSHSFVTDSTEFAFSDKLMMFVISLLVASSISTYAAGIASSFRHDLQANYLRLSAEVARYASDGINIMIHNRWLEQPPQSVNHKVLAATR